MTISVASAFRAQADHCFQQSVLTNDEKIKKHWDDLADDWLELESNQLRIDENWKALSPRYS